MQRNYAVSLGICEHGRVLLQPGVHTVKTTSALCQRNVCVCQACFYELTSFTSQSILTRKPWVPHLSFLKTEVNAAAVPWRSPVTLGVTYAM